MSTPVPATPSVQNVTSGQMRSSASDTLMASTSASLSQSYHDSPPQTRAHLPHIFSGVLEEEARAEPVSAPCGSPAMRKFVPLMSVLADAYPQEKMCAAFLGLFCPSVWQPFGG